MQSKIKYLMCTIMAIVLFSTGKVYPVNDGYFPETDATITLDLQDADLKDILKILSIQSGLNFVASEAVQERKITLYLDKVPLKEAMDKIFKANNLTYEIEKDSSVFIVKDWGKLDLVETVTNVFPLKYATVSNSSLISAKEDASSSSGSSSSSSSSSSKSGSGSGGITQAITDNLSTNGKVIEDGRSNSLVVTEIPSRMPMIAKIIEMLDVPQPQVMLEVEMLDVSKSVVDELGFDWANAGSYSMKIVSAQRTTKFPLNAFASEALKGVTSAGTLTFPTDLNWALDYLRTATDSKSLARPKILTLNNETAEISINTDEAIGIQKVTDQDTGDITETAERTATGVSLKVTPQVNLQTGEITMYIMPKVAEARESTITVGSQETKDPETRETKTTVRVRNGDTVVLGGLIRDKVTEKITQVPVFSDIPIVGALFRHKSKTPNEQRELIVFITPHLIKDQNIELAKASQPPIMPVREQEPSPFMDRFSTINSQLNNFEKKE